MNICDNKFNTIRIAIGINNSKDVSNFFDIFHKKSRFKKETGFKKGDLLMIICDNKCNAFRTVIGTHHAQSVPNIFRYNPKKRIQSNK